MSNAYDEALPAPRWLKTVLLVALALTGFNAGLALVVGGQSLLFWIAMPVSIAAIGFLYANFMVLRVRVDDAGLHAAYGLISKTIPFPSIQAVWQRPYRWDRYGGWGFARGPYGRRAWHMPGLPGGIAVRFTENGSEREYFVSSRSPEALEAAINARLPQT